MRYLILWAAIATASLTGLRAQEPRTPDVFYVPTPQEIVDVMLQVAGVTSGDVVYDLGSGDGRIPITAARVYGARGVGIDIDPARIAQATKNAQEAGVTDKVRFVQADLFTTDISPATVVTLYLTPALNTKLLPKLNAELKPGTRVVSHRFEMKNAQGTEIPPLQKRLVAGNNVFLWTAPLR